MALTPNEEEDMGLEQNWQRSSPFAVVFFAGSIARIFARSLGSALIPLVALVLLLRDNPRGFIVLFSIVAGALVLFLVIAAIQWLCFRFRIEEDRLLIRKGIFRKTALDLPFERVQGINIERSLVDRILGLVTVTLDTSGSVLAEGKLPSIRTELADCLRAGAGAFRPPPRGNASDTEEGLSDSTHLGAPPVDASSEWSMLLKLGAADMIRIGLASRNFILVLAIVGLITDLLQPGDLIEPILEAIAAGVDSVANAFSGLGAFDRVVAVTALVFTIVAGSLFLAIGAAFLRHHNFTLWGDGRTFRSRAGLSHAKGGCRRVRQDPATDPRSDPGPALVGSVPATRPPGRPDGSAGQSVPHRNPRGPRVGRSPARRPTRRGSAFTDVLAGSRGYLGATR